ncbi:DNA/RNA non-specific endonuclease [Gluconacetobacter azotocaptans]|uniref:DNA/RNA non-specific endonuclease n=1 Tax=Gluconacetobacter azotocaptans TaxID=142834 RepID=UPI0030B80681
MPCRRPRGIRIGLALLCLALAPDRAWAQAACPAFGVGDALPTLARPALAVRTHLLCNRAYAVLASGVSRGPLWSAEHLTAAAVAAAGSVPRTGVFAADQRLPPSDRAEIDDFRRSGYDRGHMAPSGDMPDDAAQQESFLLSNIVPQAGDLNRGIWAGIEEAVRKLARRDGDLYVVTGPAFHARDLSRIGGHVLVPTSTWKAVYDPARNGAGVYVCRNRAVRPTCNEVTVDTLIRVVGIDPFPALPDAVKAARFDLPYPDAGPADRTTRRQMREIERLWRRWLKG